MGRIKRFFFKNHIKNPHLFFKGDGLWNRKNRVIARHAFPARGLKNGGATRFVKKRRKNRKSRDFRNISKISGMNVRRPDTYPEKNHRDFRTVIFGAENHFSTIVMIFFRIGVRSTNIRSGDFWNISKIARFSNFFRFSLWSGSLCYFSPEHAGKACLSCFSCWKSMSGNSSALPVSESVRFKKTNADF